MSISVEYAGLEDLPAIDSGGADMSRRSLVKAGVALGAAALSTSGLFAQKLLPKAAGVPSETLAANLYKSLSPDMLKVIAFPFDHPLRHAVDNNWHITTPRVGTAFSSDQQEMIRQLFLGLHSADYADIVMRQVTDDNSGFGNLSIAFFGEPGSGKFEFVLAGRHCTRRCDGNSVDGAAFGGPMFYGHAGGSYGYQDRQANMLFTMLDGKQRERAQVDAIRAELGADTVRLTGKTTGLAGVPMTELSSDQKAEVRKTLAALVAPFRKADADEALKLIETNGFDQLHIAFQKGGNGWQIEGPAMVWWYRTLPHLHVWVNLARGKNA